MIAIQTVMLVALGFLLAGFFVVLLAPAYRARVARITGERIRAALPITEQELAADKDRMRAESAIRVHRLTTQLDDIKFRAARQMVEVNRRDGAINTLTGEIEVLRSDLDGARNARSVLEQTIADRLPKVEQRLIEAKKLLFQRDREIAGLTAEAGKTHRALAEAVQINAQHRAEIARLGMIADTQAARNRDSLSDPTFDVEVAMRAEIGALRERSREQSSLIERLQSKGEGSTAAASIAIRPMVDQPAAATNGAKSESESTASAAGDAQPSPQLISMEVERLKRELELAEQALRGLKSTAKAGEAGQLQLEAELRRRDQKIEDQANEITRLTAALDTIKPTANGEKSIALKESKIAMKSRLMALQAQTDAQTDTISRLRGDLAASNERLARQAQHFMDEMRRLGAGTLPASAQVRRQHAASTVRRSLTERITEAKPDLARAPANGGAVESGDVEAAAERLSALVRRQEQSAKNGELTGADPTPPDGSRPRLLQRISDYGKG